MVWLIRKCEVCREYTLNTDKCPYCGGKVRIPHPAKFSPQDKYATYRRAMRSLSENEGSLHQRES